MWNKQWVLESYNTHTASLSTEHGHIEWIDVLGVCKCHILLPLIFWSFKVNVRQRKLSRFKPFLLAWDSNNVLYLSSPSPGISWRSTAASMSTTATLSAVVIPVVWRFSTAEIPDSHYKLWKLKNDIKIIRMQKMSVNFKKYETFLKSKLQKI